MVLGSALGPFMPHLRAHRFRRSHRNQKPKANPPTTGKRNRISTSGAPTSPKSSIGWQMPKGLYDNIVGGRQVQIRGTNPRAESSLDGSGHILALYGLGMSPRLTSLHPHFRASDRSLSTPSMASCSELSPVTVTVKLSLTGGIVRGSICSNLPLTHTRG